MIIINKYPHLFTSVYSVCDFRLNMEGEKEKKGSRCCCWNALFSFSDCSSSSFYDYLARDATPKKRVMKNFAAQDLGSIVYFFLFFWEARE